MDFFNENRKTFVWGLIVLVIIVINMFMMTKIIAPKIKQDVINELRSPYGPSPLGVSPNPDLVNPIRPQTQAKPVKFKPFVIYPHEAGYDYSKVNSPTVQIEPVAHRDVTPANYIAWSADWERVREAR